MASDARASVFLSSSFCEIGADGDLVSVTLRGQMIQGAADLGVKVWAYEREWGAATAGGPSILDRCSAGIEECDYFAFLLTGRHGTGIDWAGGARVTASYLEAELFAAAFMGKRIVVFRREGSEVDSQLREFLVALGSVYSVVPSYVGSDAKLLRDWKMFCVTLANQRVPVFENRGSLVSALSVGRAPGRPAFELRHPGVEFVGGWKGAVCVSPDCVKIRSMLCDIRGRNKVATDPLSAAARLSRLWLVFRELAGVVHEAGISSRDAERLVLLDATLGLWTEAASWFGRLHGHTELGPLAAANSRYRLQDALRKANASKDSSLFVRPIVEARASALYSIANLADSKSRQEFHHLQIVGLVTGSIEAGDPDADAARSIRAHSFLRLAQLGRRHLAHRAEDDMRLAIRYAEVTGAPPGKIGILVFDYGFIQWLVGKRREGWGNIIIGERAMRENLAFVGEDALERARNKMVWAKQEVREGR